MAEPLSNRQLAKYFFVVLILSLIIGSISLVYPFGRDQGIYAYIAKLILNGKVDFKYSYNLRPPGTHYVFAIGQLFFGESMIGMRIFDIIWQALTAFVMFRIVLLLTGKKNYGLISAGLYLFLYYRLSYWHTMQTEGFMNLPFALCIFLLIKPDTGKIFKKYFFAGFIFAAASMFKFTIASFMLLFVIVIFAQPETGIKEKLKKVFLLVSGAFVLTLAVLIYYYFNNALSEFLEIQFVQIPHYARIGFETETPGFISSNIIRLFIYSVYSPLIFLSVVLFVVLAAKKKFNSRDSVLLIWLLSSLLSLIMQWKFFYYHFLIIVPPAVVSSAYSVYTVSHEFKEKFSKYVTVTSAFVIIVFVLLAAKPYYSRYADLFSLLSGKQSMDELYIKNGTTSDSVFTISKVYKVTDYVKQNTDESDGIYIWGIEPLIYFLSGRDCVSRFTYNTPLYWRGDDSGYQKEFINSIQNENPKLILVARRDPMYNITGYNEDSELMLNNFTEFKDIIEKNYELKADIAEFKIYQLLTPFSK